MAVFHVKHRKTGGRNRLKVPERADFAENFYLCML